MPLEMEHLYSKLDVTAIIFFGNLILTGIGGSVYVFSAKRKSLITKKHILNRYKIRGLSCSSGDQALAYGGKEVGVFKILKKASEVEIIEVTLLKQDDWVIYSKWVDSNLNIATLSAHNVVAIWCVKERSKLWQLACQEQNILYSGFIFGDSSIDLICFGGSVFGQVVIWSVHAKHLQSSISKCSVLHYLKGHKGAVFSVNYDPESCLICTTSDDRSVRWWHVSWSSGGIEQGSIHSLFELWSSANIHMISVGFGHLARVWKCLSAGSLTFTVGEDSQICIWKNFEVKDAMNEIETEAVEFPLLARKHILRGGSIWSVDFSSTYGLALGLEDGSILLWSLSTLLCPSLISHLPPLEKNDPSRRICLYGKRLQPMVITKSGALAVSTGLDYSTPNWQYILEDHRCTGLGLLETSHNRNSIVVTSSNGAVVVLSGNSKLCGSEDIKYVAKANLTKGYPLSVHWLAEDLILTCGSEGKLQLWLLLPKERNVVLEEVGSWILPCSKQCWTTSAVWIPLGAPPGLILCGNRSGDLLVYSGALQNPLQVLRNVHGHMGITSFLVSWGKNDMKKTKEEHWMPTYHEMYIECHQPHLENIYKHSCDAVIYSTGRNGILNSYVIKEGLVKIKGIERLGFEWAARCLMLNESIFVFGFKGACAVIWGLQERSILLEKNCGGGHRSWDLDFLPISNEIMHLRLALIKNGELTLINWKMPSGSLLRSVLQEGLHSKEINCVRWFNLMALKHIEIHSSSPLLMISGSEDTTAKVSTFSPSGIGDTFALSTINSLYGHLSSVRTLFVLPLPHNEKLLSEIDKSGIPLQATGTKKNEGIKESFQSFDFMIFTAGGRAQMKAWKLSFNQSEKGEQSYSFNMDQCRVEEQSSLLLGTKKHGQKEVLNDPEARFMDICAFFPSVNVVESEKLPDQSTLVVVVAACSDGLLRIFGYRDDKNKSNHPGMNPHLGLWSQGIPHIQPSKRHCLYRVSHRLLCDHHILITTDCVGYFHLWDVTSHVDSMRVGLEQGDLAKDFLNTRANAEENFSPFFSKLVHQFSINAVDWLELSRRNSSDCNLNIGLSSLLLVATGGEDGTLEFNLLKLTRKCDNEPWNHAVVQISWCQEFAMATQISGLKFVQNKYLVTVSKDQQVTLWTWKCNIENSFISASVVSQYFSSIPDIQDIEVIKMRDGIYISICGCGLEVLRLSIPEENK